MPRILVFGAVLALALTAARVAEDLQLAESQAALKAMPKADELHNYLLINPKGLPPETPR